MSKPLTTLHLHSFLQLMDAPLVVSEDPRLKFANLNANFNPQSEFQFTTNSPRVHFPNFFFFFKLHLNVKPKKKSEKEFYVFAVRRRFMKTRPQSCPHQCLTSTLLRYFCFPTLQLHTLIWTQQLLWPGSSVASLWWCLYTGALINMGIISHTYTLDFSLESPLSITVFDSFSIWLRFSCYQRESWSENIVWV